MSAACFVGVCRLVCFRRGGNREERVVYSSELSDRNNICLDIGSDLGSPVSKDYFDLAPFSFNGTIGTTKIWYPKK